jgi:TolB-like protein
MSADESPLVIDLAREARFRVGAIEVRPATRELVGGGRREVLEPRVMQVLVALARRRGEVVSRAELISACWAGRVVGDDAINRCLGIIRRVADAHGGFSVETVARVGYRLSADGPVRADPLEANHEPAAPSAADRDPLLAVLAFDNLSGDPDMIYFSDGISEEILQTVARGADLKVIGRASSFQFRGAEKAARHVAAELNVTHVLDGSVRRSGQRVRVSAQLVECASETTLWSERFDRELTDIFVLQDEIAIAVAAALKTAFAPSKSSGAIDPAAYDLYLRARAAPVQDPLRAVEMLEAAVSLAPGFARAWAELAMLRVRAYQNLRLPTVKRADAAEAAAKALELDPSLGVVYAALSLVEPLGNYLARETLLLKALAVSPTDATPLATMSILCADTGRMHASLDYAKRGMELDPKYWRAACWYALALDSLGRYAESRPLWEEHFHRWPEASVSITMNALASAGDGGDWAWFETLVSETPSSLFAEHPEIRGMVPFYRSLRDPNPGHLSRLRASAERALAESGAVPLNLLTAECSMGLLDEAFRLVDQSSYEFVFDPDGALPGQGNMRSVLFRKANWPMINDPRFLILCAKLGLCDYWIATDCWPDCADEVPYDFRSEARRLAGAHHPTD